MSAIRWRCMNALFFLFFSDPKRQALWVCPQARYSSVHPASNQRALAPMGAGCREDSVHLCVCSCACVHPYPLIGMYFYFSVSDKQMRQRGHTTATERLGPQSVDVDYSALLALCWGHRVKLDFRDCSAAALLRTSSRFHRRCRVW